MVMKNGYQLSKSGGKGDSNNCYDATQPTDAQPPLRKWAERACSVDQQGGVKD